MGGRWIVVAGALALAASGCGEGGAPAPPVVPDPPDGPVDEQPQRRIEFGTQGPWPAENAIYGKAQGILEGPVVGVTTDEAQNRWVATNAALYLLRPGETTFRRYAGADGLHLPGFPAEYCGARPMQPGERCDRTREYGEAAPPGIARIVGGGPDEVFVGYHGVPKDETLVCRDTMTGEPLDQSVDFCDPYRHSGKMDRVRLREDGTLEVDRFDFVAIHHGAQYWHNRSVRSVAYDHFAHPGTLYVGMEHGVNVVFPDRFRYPNPGEWFDDANVEWMGDHLHAQVCHSGPCDPNSGARQKLGGWRGLAIDANGDVWQAGKWTAGLITWDADPFDWVFRHGAAFKVAFGDPYPTNPNDEGFQNEPVFKVNAEADEVNLTGVAVCPDGRVWFASRGPQTGTTHTLAVWKGRSFDTFDPAALGLGETALADIECLPDGRVVLAGPSKGVVLYDPAAGTSVRVGGLPSQSIHDVEVDRMVSPPSLHVATSGGAAVLRVLP